MSKDKLPSGHHPFSRAPYPPLIPVQNHSPPPSSSTIAGHTLPPPGSSTKNSNQEPQKAQLSAMASLSVATIPSLAAPAAKKRSGVTYVEGMNAYSGLKALNKVTMLGVRKTADYSFAKIVASLSPAGSKRRGGTFGAQCSVAGEIFRIAVIMNGLVLVGVAVGFVLLRVEAAVEESE